MSSQWFIYRGTTTVMSVGDITHAHCYLVPIAMGLYDVTRAHCYHDLLKSKQLLTMEKVIINSLNPILMPDTSLRKVIFYFIKGRLLLDRDCKNFFNIFNPAFYERGGTNGSPLVATSTDYSSNGQPPPVATVIFIVLGCYQVNIISKCC
jgi:hypothetical protein